MGGAGSAEWYERVRVEGIGWGGLGRRSGGNAGARCGDAEAL